MIRYSLACAEAHAFESWFPSGEAFELQRDRGLVACPFCGSTAVEKQIMAPAVARTDRGARADRDSQAAAAQPEPGPEAPPPPRPFLSPWRSCPSASRRCAPCSGPCASTS